MNTNKPYGEQNHLNLKTIIALNRARNHISKRSATLFKAHGLTTMQFAVLEALYHKGDLSIGEIIEKILATGGNMTVVVQNLLKEGLVEKYAHSNDQRVRILHLTPKGKETIQKIFPRHLEQLEEDLSALSNEEKTQLIGVLRKLQSM